jgi:glycosyltransferase involved in cell wall biosynthesis
VAQALAAPQEFRMQHLHTPGERGLSRGRNRGFARCSGDLVVFPDDDCWYPADFLERAVSLLRADGVQFVCGRAADETGRTINGRFETTRQAVTRANVWTTSIEWMQVFETDAVAAVGGYDERVGIGASTPWHSAEGQEMVLRILAAGKRGLYDPSLIGHHEELRIHRPDRQLRLKLRRYARGMGHVLRKHGYGPVESAKWVVRPIGGASLSLLRLDVSRAALYGNVALGRIEGYVGHPKPDASPSRRTANSSGSSL